MEIEPTPDAPVPAIPAEPDKGRRIVLWVAGLAFLGVSYVARTRFQQSYEQEASRQALDEHLTHVGLGMDFQQVRGVVGAPDRTREAREKGHTATYWYYGPYEMRFQDGGVDYVRLP